ncbi:MAG: type II secretion system protein GspM [Gammaproteobacteria bacterium]
MKQQLLALRERVNAISVRERVMMFCATIAAIVFLLYSFVLGPLNTRRAAALAQIAQQQNNIAGIEAEISAAVQAYANDPDKASRDHLAGLKAEVATLTNDLRTTQNSLVPPERVAPLLEAMLKANGRLQLVGMKTLPVTAIQSGAGTIPAPVAAVPATAPAPSLTALAGVSPSVLPTAPAPAPGTPVVLQPDLPVLYKHGVELTVRGSYLDMVSYMDTLAGMPNRLFWGQANLQVEQYPNACLTLTLYTLSLDQKWMKL